jgi:murein DD-endopeptidase MepM/ murein hydrolase activator NlpD
MRRSGRTGVFLLLASLLLGFAGLCAWSAPVSAAGRPGIEESAGAPRLAAGQRTARAQKKSRPAGRRAWKNQDPTLGAILARSRAILPAEAPARPAPAQPLTAPERAALEESLQEEIAPSSVPALAPHPSAVPFTWPVVGRLNSPFGPRRARFHTGIDIGAPQGSPVVAAADGRVLYARTSRGPMGKVVVLEHVDGLRTVYAHLSQLGAKEGKAVRQGDRIGAVGRTGRSTGPHLHFEIRDQGTPVPPQGFLPGGPDESAQEVADAAPAPVPDLPEPAPADTSAAPTPPGEPSS